MCYNQKRDYPFTIRQRDDKAAYDRIFDAVTSTRLKLKAYFAADLLESGKLELKVRSGLLARHELTTGADLGAAGRARVLSGCARGRMREEYIA